MIIRLRPMFDLPPLTLVKRGDALTINGTEYDFTPLPDGATLPASAIECPHIFGDVERVDGELTLTVFVPNARDSTEAARFPEPVRVTEDGPVELPV